MAFPFSSRALDVVMYKEMQTDAPPRGEPLCFGPFFLFPQQRVLMKGQTPVQVGSRALELLIALVERAGQVLSKRELISHAWPGMFVAEANLRVHIVNLRRALGDTSPPFRYVATVQNRGYCFVAAMPRGGSAELASGAVAERRYHLPDLGTDMIGRAPAIDALTPQLLQRRLLTIVGPGGIGKSTLALALAHATQADYQNGACFINLAPLTSPDLLLSAVASILEIPLRSADPMSGLMDFLRGKQILLVLDSCEHVIDAAAIFAEAIRLNAPNVRIMATSREPLRVDGEHVYRLAPLALPTQTTGIGSEQAQTFSAIELFTIRAAATLDGFRLSDADAPAVAEICRKLDGMPLAIELAASRVDVLGVAGLATRLRDRLRLLSHGRRTAHSRHRTLNATLAWSYDFLEVDEQAVLRRLAVFPGPFTLAGAQSVTAFNGLDKSAIVDHVGNLATKSLIAVTIDKTGALYRLLDTTRAYASEKLGAADEANQAARQHAACLLETLPAVEKEIATTSSTASFNSYRRLIDDVRAALDWAFSPGGDPLLGAALVANSVPLWIRLSLISECRRWVEHVLAAAIAIDPAVRMRLMAARATVLLYTYRGMVPIEMKEAWSEVLEIALKLEDVQYSLRGLWGLWAFAHNGGTFPEALLLARKFCDLATRSINPVDLATGDRMTGMTLKYLGDQAVAQTHLERSLARLDSTSHGTYSIHFQYNQSLAARAYLPKVLWIRGFPDAASDAARSAVHDAGAVGHALSHCLVLTYAGCPIPLLVGNLKEAKQFTDILVDTSTTHAIDLWLTEARCFEGAVLVRSGHPQEGIRILLSVMSGPPYMETNIHRVERLIELSHAFACIGDLQRGMDVLDEALTECDRKDERWCMPELLRMKADLLLGLGASGAETLAEEILGQALGWARRQSALSWELRTALSFARLRKMQDRPRDGLAILSPCLTGSRRVSRAPISLRLETCSTDSTAEHSGHGATLQG